MRLKYFTWYLDDEAEKPYYYYVFGKVKNEGFLVLNNWDWKWSVEIMDIDSNDFTGDPVEKLELKEKQKKALVRFIYTKL